MALTQRVVLALAQIIRLQMCSRLWQPVWPLRKDDMHTSRRVTLFLFWIRARAQTCAQKRRIQPRQLPDDCAVAAIRMLMALRFERLVYQNA